MIAQKTGKTAYVVLDRPMRGKKFGSLNMPDGTTIHWVSREVFNRALAAAAPILKQTSEKMRAEARAHAATMSPL